MSLKELMGKNYQLVQEIENALLINPEPFYNSFGDENAVTMNIEFITEHEGIDPEDIQVTFKAAPEKFVRGIIMEVPDCKQEMDSKFFVITYIGHDYEYFTCELMEGENFALRCNEDIVIKLFDKTPTADEIWEIVEARYKEQHVDGLYFAVLYNHDTGFYSYMLFDDKSEEFRSHWFGTPYLLPERYTVNGVDYVVYTAIGCDNVALFRSENGELKHVQYGDAKVLKELRLREGI